jgi:hypothetical protein
VLVVVEPRGGVTRRRVGVYYMCMYFPARLYPAVYKELKIARRIEQYSGNTNKRGEACRWRRTLRAAPSAPCMRIQFDTGDINATAMRQWGANVGAEVGHQLEAMPKDFKHLPAWAIVLISMAAICVFFTLLRCAILFCGHYMMVALDECYWLMHGDERQVERQSLKDHAEDYTDEEQGTELQVAASRR